VTKRRIKKAIKKVIELKSWSAQGCPDIYGSALSHFEIDIAIENLYEKIRWIKYKWLYEAIPNPPKPKRMLRPKRCAAG
jgi:hypothetical protein